MQLPLLAPRGFYLPSGMPGIDWTNPITDGLVTAFVYNGQGRTPTDLVGGLKLTSGTPGTNGMTQVGGGWRFNSASTQISYVTTGRAGPISGLNNASMFLFFTPVTLATSQTFFNFSNSGNTASTTLIKTDATTSSKVRAAIVDSAGNNASISQTSGTMVAGVPITAGISMAFNGVGTNTLYVNGIASGTSAATAGTMTQDTTALGGSYLNGVGAQANVTIHCAFAWNRQLSADEQLALGRNPSLFILYPEDYIQAEMVGVISATLAAGAASTLSTGSTIASVTVNVATGGTAPYTYQWYRSTSSGFTPGGGNIVGGATNRTLNDTGLTNGTIYYYKNVVTDNVAATSISNQTSATPTALTSGVASTQSVGSTTASVTVGSATGGSVPYTYQWYRSTANGFTPSAGNIVAGATSQTLNDSGLLNGVIYYYICVTTDNVSATVNSNQTIANPNIATRKLSQIAAGGAYASTTDLVVAVRSLATDYLVSLPASLGSYNLADYNSGSLVCTGKVISDVTTTASSANITSAGQYAFTSADAGKLVIIVASGSVTKVFAGTISIVSGGTVTLSGTVPSSLTNAVMYFGFDDLAAWTAAIAAATASTRGGGTILLPAGMSMISAPIVIGTKTSIIGQGMGTSCIKWASSHGMAQTGYEAAITGVVNSSGNPYTNNVFADFEVDMVGAFYFGSPDYRAKCIDIVFMLRPLFRNLYLHDSPSTALGVDYVQEGLFIGNFIEGAGRLADTNTDGNAIALEYGTYTQESSIFVHNILINSYASAIRLEAFGIPSSSTLRCSAIGNLILTANTTSDGIDDEGITGFVCTDNVIINTGTSTTGAAIISGQGTKTTQTDAGIQGIIANNYIKGWFDGIQIKNDVVNNVSPSQYSVRGNTIVSSINSGILIKEDSPNTLSTLNITNNYITGTGAAGIQFTNGGTTGIIKNLTLSGNTISDCGATTGTDIQKSGILINATVTGAVITNNYCFDDGASKQKYGLTVATGIAVTLAQVSNNNVQANVTQGFNLVGTLTGWINDNWGYNPIGASSLSPGASPWTYTAGSTPEIIYLYGGTVSAVAKNSITLATALSATTSLPVSLQPGEAMTVTYTVVPTAVKDQR